MSPSRAAKLAIVLVVAAATTACRQRAHDAVTMVPGAPPEPRTPQPAPAPPRAPGPMVITVAAGGLTTLDGVPIGVSDLALAARSRAALDPDTRAVIASEPSVRYADVVRVMDSLRSGGVTNIEMQIGGSTRTFRRTL